MKIGSGEGEISWTVVATVAPLALGAITYLVLEIVYAEFYRRLGTTPEAVGFGRAQLLSDAAVSLAVYVVVALMAGLVGGAFAFVGENAAERKRYFKVGWLLAGGVYVVVLIPVVLFAHAHSDSLHAQDGVATRARGVPPLRWLGIDIAEATYRATPAHVTLPPNAKGDPGGITRRLCLMYLGNANGDSVFYDVKAQSTVQVPTNAVMIELRKNERRLPSSCRRSG